MQVTSAYSAAMTLDWGIGESSMEESATFMCWQIQRNSFSRASS